MIEIGKVYYHDHYWTERVGYFVIESACSKPGHYIGRRIMKPDGTIVKASKLRPMLDEVKLTLFTQADAQKRYEDAITAAMRSAETELHYLMKFVG